MQNSKRLLDFGTLGGGIRARTCNNTYCDPSFSFPRCCDVRKRCCGSILCGDLWRQKKEKGRTRTNVGRAGRDACFIMLDRRGRITRVSINAGTVSAHPRILVNSCAIDWVHLCVRDGWRVHCFWRGCRVFIYTKINKCKGQEDDRRPVASSKLLMP